VVVVKEVETEVDVVPVVVVVNDVEVNVIGKVVNIRRDSQELNRRTSQTRSLINRSGHPLRQRQLWIHL
jgi:hypothetical protein